MVAIFNNTPFMAGPIATRAVFGQSSASLVVKATFDIVPGAPAVVAKDQRPLSADAMFMDALGRSLAWPDDMVPFKPRLDFFILGSFHQPGGTAAPEGRCAFRFGPLQKELRILGPRIASRTAAQGREPAGRWVVSAPEPIISVPLRWELSLGGLRDPRNPFGLGRDTEQRDGIETVRLPLIESRATPDAPDNFAPVPAMFELRRRKLGTRDQRWMLFRAPLPPEDFDPSHVNAAPADQQAGDSPRGDEGITLTNLHATYPALTAFLPGLRTRLAVLRSTPRGVLAEEIAMRLDTVAVLPEEMQIVLLWRGVVPLSPDSDLDREILAVEIDAEALDAPATCPDLPQRLLARWEAREAAQKARDLGLETAARDEMKKLLPQANLPADLAAMVENDADPLAIFEAIEKHVLASVAAIQAKLPKV